MAKYERARAPKQPRGLFRDEAGAAGKLSMSRVIALIGALAGTALVTVGAVMAFTTANADLARVYRDIILAGLGVFGAGGLTKALNRIGEGLTKK